MVGRPVDRRGFPVPFFVAEVDGEWRFDIVDPKKYQQCIDRDLCWLCGERLGRYRAFVIGPMCVINRVSSEPPSHLDCAEFACTACPFLTRPMARRNPDKEGFVAPAGDPVERNPGASAVWVTERGGYRYFVPKGSRSALVQLDSEPVQLHAWAHGKPLQWDAMEESMQSGIPYLRDMCNGIPEHLQALDVAVALAHRTIDRFRVRVPA